MKETYEIRKKNAQDEFKDIVSTYMIPLMDTRGKLKFRDRSVTNTELVSIQQNEMGQSTIYFYPRIGTEENPSPFYCEIASYSGAELKKRAACILDEILMATEYDYSPRFLKKRDYGKSFARQKSYKGRYLDLAFELGMCRWLTPDYNDASILHTIISRMIEWSSKTYEGKSVPFGIVIDFKKAAADDAADYLHFLENDSSAVFTDGIFTGILLDKRGKVLSFLTRNTASPQMEADKEIFVPYQFEDIAQHCVDETIGIIVLTNGEILLIKNREVCFAKRGRRWISFSNSRIYSILREYFLLGGFEDEKLIRRNIQAVYCTLLDVSFAHTGGCLALVLPDKIDKINDVIKDRIDLFAAGAVPSGMSSESKEKIEVLTYLLSYPQHTMRSFFEIEKPLRKEILSLDGATVVSLNGDFYCAGSIVSVPGGSSGGGRTAATKKLAQYGVGIKISEDGYIEAYGFNQSEKDGSIKGTGRINLLFRFK